MRALAVLLSAALLACTLPTGRTAQTAGIGRKLSFFDSLFGNDEPTPAPPPPPFDPNYVRPIHAYNAITATTAYVLLYVLPELNATAPAQSVQWSAASGASGSVDLWLPAEGDAVLVFRTAAAASLAGAEAKRVPFLQPFVYTAEGPAGVVDAFSALLSQGGAVTGDGPLAEALEAATGGKAAQLRRVVCTGDDVGGMELAVLCGPWAALRYPLANADVVTFGGGWSPAYNAPFAWAWQQLVTLHYLWPFGLDAIQPNASTGSVLLDAAAAVNPLVTADSVAAAVQVPGLPAPVPPAYEGWDPEDPLGALGPDPNLAEQYKLPPSDCPVILCKTRAPLALSCLGFGKDAAYGQDVLEGLPNVVLSDAETSGDAIVAWNETDSTLYMLFKYTEERQDWLIDAQASQSEDFVPSIEPFSQAPPGNRLSDIFPDVEVHSGFFKQFSSLAIEPVQPGAASCAGEGVPLSALLQAACNLTGGDEPLRVVSSGFSLGGALSELGGVWAAQVWPGASILVANQGAPIVGDNNFALLAQAVVGRFYKYVYRLDEVPSIPPLPDYQQTQSGLWIQDGAVLLQDRPNLELWETNWDDHTCNIWENPDTGEVVVGYVPQLQNATRVTVPAWVFTATLARR